MTRFCSAFSALWRHAPLWRLCVCLCGISIALAVFFPTHTLTKLAPWLPNHALETASQPNNTHNTALGPQASNSGSAASHPMPVHLQYPDLAETITGHITLGNHTLLLPHGAWHPVLAAQITDNSPYSFLALIRTELGAVTGILIAQATEQPIPLEQVMAETDVCHDDRNYLNNTLTTAQAVEDCAALRLITLHGPTPSDSPFTNEAIARLNVMGFPIPPLFVTAQWRHIEATNDGRAQVGTMDFLIPPLNPQTHQLLAPPPAWLKDALPSHPVSAHFVARMKKWLPQWQNILQASFEDQLDDTALPAGALRDPMAGNEH